jgi:hypothetical protein
MLKSLLSRHCMQCKDGCQGSCGQLRSPRPAFPDLLPQFDPWETTLLVGQNWDSLLDGEGGAK